MAEGLHDALASRNSATTKHPISKLESRPIVWRYLRDPIRLAVLIQYRSVTDAHTHTYRQTDTRRRHIPRLV